MIIYKENIEVLLIKVVIFHNLRGYDGHLIMQDIDKFDTEINVIPNEFEKHMAFIININLVLLTTCNL